MRKWVDVNQSIDQASLFDKLYEKLYDNVKPECYPDVILILDEYQDKATRVVNPKINMAACMTQLMAVVQFK